jgi:hypothetical protein
MANQSYAGSIQPDLEMALSHAQGDGRRGSCRREVKLLVQRKRNGAHGSLHLHGRTRPKDAQDSLCPWRAMDG